MSKLEAFIKEYQEKFIKTTPLFDENLLGLLQKAKYILLDEKMSASMQLEEALTKLQQRAKEPMKVAITGQFSSGKSTFLNALLSKNILPTGITPVTSKVNYIRYADELKIRVRYKDGVDEYHNVEEIAKFTDQRGDVEEIEYLTLYAPLEILKDIVFVDTPGLNSNSNADTSVTQQVLKEVDGIIWLSLIDNAGKMSEARVLEQYLCEYQNKSLCVLNQKDKFTQEQVSQTLEYVKKSFAQFFSEVIPISAIQALESRSHDKNVLVNEALEQFLTALKQKLNPLHVKEEEKKILDEYALYKEEVEKILKSDLSQNMHLLAESNIQAVLDFIYTQIRPQALSAKEYAIKKELKTICIKLQEQYGIFLTIHEELKAELRSFESEAQERFSELKRKFAKDLKEAYAKIEQLIETIANNIYSHIDSQNRLRYVLKKNSLFQKSEVYEAIEYKAPKIDSDAIYKELFYDDELVNKMFKKYVKHLKDIQDEVNENNAEVFEMLKKRIRKWQNPYELVRKPKKLYSDIEFANIRKFASKAYENILKPFSDEIHASYAKISSEFNHLSSAVSFNYQNATEVSVAFLEKKIEKSIELYVQNPTRFSLYQPKLEDIKERLSRSFHLYELQNYMSTNNTFLNKNYDRLMDEFAKIAEQREEFIEKRESRYRKIIEMLKEFEEEI
ncbi:MAG TPA: dynamin [Sulfurospirillum sp. UBA11407]|nr:MAG TPA: dynamin [Sulfurospirillum sp. UBA11407]